jgi:hypothetical protein
MSRQNHSCYFSRYVYCNWEHFTLGSFFSASCTQKKKEEKKSGIKFSFLIIKVLSLGHPLFPLVHFTIFFAMFLFHLLFLPKQIGGVCRKYLAMIWLAFAKSKSSTFFQNCL